MTTNTSISKINLRAIFKIWWPLAASWLLMAVESPMVSAVIARLPSPEFNLAAFGSVVEPLRTLTSAPLIMMLAASTALSRDWLRYRQISRYMMIIGMVLTVLHLLLAFTPLYFFVVQNILGIPAEIVPLARTGLMIMLPIPWSIGYRRFQQGVMIRNGYSNAVVVGTFVRLSTVSLVLAGGYLFTSFSGVIVGAAALTAGMFSEAVYSGLRIRPILRMLPREVEANHPLTWRSFVAFYLPLVLTSFLTMIWRPIGSAAISRMPFTIESLAVWPVVSGLIFLFQTMGISYNEVVVSMIDRPGAYYKLRKFAILLSTGISALFLIIVITPLSNIWFDTISALPANLLPFANRGIWFLLPLPGIAVFMSWFQGVILYSQKTRGIPEAVAVFLVTMLLLLGTGIALNSIPGIYVGAVGFSIATILQAAWLWRRAKPVLQSLRRRDAGL